MLMNSKIFPLNLTARAARIIPGNPVVTRLESGVANCFPGLEFDHRNLDRRFFPGLTWSFISSDSPERNRIRGARLTDVDVGDPAIFDPRAGDAVVQQLRRDLGALSNVFDPSVAGDLGRGTWYLTRISQ